MSEKTDILQGTLTLMTLKTLETLGPLHGYGIARRIEQISGDRLVINYGTIYPILLKLEQEGYISAEWGVSDNNRKAKYYELTRAGRKQLAEEKAAKTAVQLIFPLVLFIFPGIFVVLVGPAAINISKNLLN